MRWEQIKVLQGVPGAALLERVHCLPGKHGLAATFWAMWMAEQDITETEVATVTTTLAQEFKEERGLACPAQVDQQVVLPLPTEDQ